MSLRQATLGHFRIREILAKDHTRLGEKASSSGNIRLNPEVEFSCPEDFSEPFHIVVTIRVSAVLEGKATRKKIAPPRAEASISGEALFNVHVPTKREFIQLFEDVEFLDRIAEQVYPLVTIRLNTVLSDMGFTSQFPLSLPEVDDGILENEADSSLSIEASTSSQRKLTNKTS
jgi:hypothetical protein